MREIILDANAILRYVLDDIKEQADAVEKTLENETVLILPPPYKNNARPGAVPKRAPR